MEGTLSQIGFSHTARINKASTHKSQMHFNPFKWECIQLTLPNKHFTLVDKTLGYFSDDFGYDHLSATNTVLTDPNNAEGR